MLNPSLQLDETALLRFVFVGHRAGHRLRRLLADHATARSWEVGTREVVYMAIGAALYAIFSYLFNGTVFVVPSVSQVALRPAIVHPDVLRLHLRPGGGLLHRGGRQHVRRCADRLRPLAAVERRQRPGRHDRRHGLAVRRQEEEPEYGADRRAPCWPRSPRCSTSSAATCRTCSSSMSGQQYLRRPADHRHGRPVGAGRLRAGAGGALRLRQEHRRGGRRDLGACWAT